MESATCCGMESRLGEHGINANCIVWNQEQRETEKYTLSRDARPDEVGIPYTLKRDAMRGRAAIPYNSQSELMPYQALRSWINKKTNRSSSFYFGGASLTKIEPLLFVNL